MESIKYTIEDILLYGHMVDEKLKEKYPEKFENLDSFYKGEEADLMDLLREHFEKYSDSIFLRS